MRLTAPAALKEEETRNFVQLDAEEAEERYRLEPVEFLTAEKIFDARWAMTVLGEALKQLRQEYATAGKTSTFEALKAFLDPNNSMNSALVRRGGESASGYDRRGQNTYPSVAKALHRALRSKFTSAWFLEVCARPHGDCRPDLHVCKGFGGSPPVPDTDLRPWFWACPSPPWLAAPWLQSF